MVVVDSLFLLQQQQQQEQIIEYAVSHRQSARGCHTAERITQFTSDRIYGDT